MFLHCELLILILVLTLHGQVHTGEIIGGHEAEPHSRPYMVLLEGRTQDGELTHCGGFLLNEDFVMTAAHCKANYTALLGLHNARNRAEIQNISVEKKYPHEDYNEDDHKGDIMLLKLSSKAKFSKDVKPIALTDQGDGSLPTNCAVSGWGRLDQNSIYMSDVLMEVNVTLVDSEQCAQDNVYCSEVETGPGEGDSGGPLVCGDGKAYGVVSLLHQEMPDASKRYHYTKIPDYRRWIDSISGVRCPRCPPRVCNTVRRSAK
ncbi:granzyme B(G,H)-like [Sebastes umbrosus]|uniref:granzyme B(G,H)-like n=1 Tax=Sebastes umbrosus TaxID=72105 RepID=UPI00189DB1BA|nr:granzyme B(G,H)-like [Sebastes umbrosus]